jgi:trehalose/maltose hydrolase-like predicted phosphorylase
VWAQADGMHYPGTYIAGVYNRLRTDIAGRVVENEHLVNFPNWLMLGFRIADEDWFDPRMVKLLSYRQELNLRQGMLLREISFEDSRGRRTKVQERRLVSMSDMHLGAVQLALTAENWSGSLTVRSAIDGCVVNAGAQLYRKFNNKHLEPLAAEQLGEDGIYMLVRTCQSNVQVALAARTQVFVGGQVRSATRQTIKEPGFIGQDLMTDLREGETLVVEKITPLYTSRDQAISECGLAVRKAITRAARFGALVVQHTRAWNDLWGRFDLYMEPTGPAFELNVLILLRMNLFHLLQTASRNSLGLDIGIPARGWTGEGYQGHIFWDELFIFPTLNYRIPEITRSLLMYRYQRLGEARVAATNAGFQGAMFPWQSGSDGQEQTEKVNLNPRSKRWVPDNSYLQRHVSSAIAYNVWQYFQITHDLEFLQFYGAELILEIARFWSSIASFNKERGRYEIRGVMGPDEFHEGYSNAALPGLNNNAYTNVMAVWVLLRALDVLNRLPEVRRAELTASLGLSAEEIARWDDISRKMYLPFHGDGLISQFEGYEQLAELDWERYRARYGNIQRLELILEAENDSANRYKLSKQADVLMLFYMFSAEELGGLFKRLGYPFEYDTIPRNVSYYTIRASHGSTLSRVVHAWVLARSDRPRSMKYFEEALQSDFSDIQQGTTAEGVHLGAMAGTLDLVQRVLMGIEVMGDVLRLNPQLPQGVKRFEMRMRYRDHSLDLQLTSNLLIVRDRDHGAAPITLQIGKQIQNCAGVSIHVFNLG